jgi:hypothetical protein
MPSRLNLTGAAGALPNDRPPHHHHSISIPIPSYTVGPRVGLPMPQAGTQAQQPTPTAELLQGPPAKL